MKGISIRGNMLCLSLYTVIVHLSNIYGLLVSFGWEF